MDKKKKLLMVVGRSGGHIYPALAIAEALEDAFSKSIEISFLHAGSPLGKKILSQSSYPFYEIQIGGLASGQKFWIKLKTLFQLPVAFFKTFLLIRAHSFDAVLGTGGAVTGPALLMARLLFCHTYIWEANATSGIANKYLSFIVHKSFTAFEKVSGLQTKRQVHCAYPLRKSIENHNSSKENHNSSKENHNSSKENQNQDNKQAPFKLLILGGSQGSVLLNQVLVEALQDKSWSSHFFIYHQTGIRHYQEIQKQYQSYDNVKAFDFSSKIYDYYKDSDVIISRAGSGAIFEIAAFQKTLVLVPLSYSAGGHQLQNARQLHSKKAADLIQEKDFNVENFKNKILFLKNNQEHRKSLANNLSQYYKKNGAKLIAESIKKDLEKK